jgi:hypothetical protein
MEAIDHPTWSCRFKFKERVPVLNVGAWVIPRSDIDAVEGRNISASIWNRTPIPNRPIRSLNTIMTEFSQLYIIVSNKAKPVYLKH